MQERRHAARNRGPGGAIEVRHEAGIARDPDVVIARSADRLKAPPQPGGHGRPDRPAPAKDVALDRHGPEVGSVGSPDAARSIHADAVGAGPAGAVEVERAAGAHDPDVAVAERDAIHDVPRHS